MGATLARPLLVRTSDQLTDTPAQNIGVNFEITEAGGAAGQQVSPAAAASDGLGFAQTFLTLGDKPGEYSVRAYSPDAGPDAEFKACAYLPNDDFKQSSATWASLHYDSICSTVPINSGEYRPVYSCSAPIFQNSKYKKYSFTINAKGCAISAFASLINYYIDEYHLGISSVTPGALNQYLKENLGYVQGDVDFYSIKAISGNRLKYSGGTNIGERGVSRSVLVRKIDEAIANDVPVIIRVPGHFMLVTGKCGREYVVSNPGPSIQGNIRYDPFGKRPLMGIRKFQLTQEK